MGNISPFTEHGLEILPLIFSVFCELLPFHIQQNNFIKLFGSIRFNPLPFEIISRITIHLSYVPSDIVYEKGVLETALSYAYTSVRDLPPDGNATFGIDCDGKSVSRSAIARIEFLQPGQM